jgi:hypothetical protein
MYVQSRHWLWHGGHRMKQRFGGVLWILSVSCHPQRQVSQPGLGYMSVTPVLSVKRVAPKAYL